MFRYCHYDATAVVAVAVVGVCVASVVVVVVLVVVTDEVDVHTIPIVDSRVGVTAGRGFHRLRAVEHSRKPRGRDPARPPKKPPP